MALIKCPECAKEVSSVAIACPSCGHPIMLPPPAASPPIAVAAPKWNPGIAALLSLVIPGAGQMYKGQVVNGLLFLLITAVGYAMLIVPGVIMHLFCIVNAASGDPLN